MERHGFIRTMMDVKILILYTMYRVEHPVVEQQIYELCYQDECVSYFDVCEAIPQMVESQHLEKIEGGYAITQQGRDACVLVEDSLAFPVAQRVLKAVAEFNEATERGKYTKTHVITGDDDTCTVVMELENPLGKMLKMELMAPSREQARLLERNFQAHGEEIYQTILAIMLDEIE